LYSLQDVRRLLHIRALMVRARRQSARRESHPADGGYHRGGDADHAAQAAEMMIFLR
jgi:hypothetical protein